MRVLLHRRARADLAEIRSFLREQGGTELAERIRRHLQLRIMRLGEFPSIGISSNYPGIRLLSPTTYPYRIYFTVVDEAVVILHIRHTSRDEPKIDDILP